MAMSEKNENLSSNKKKKMRIPAAAWIGFVAAFLLAAGIIAYHTYYSIHGTDISLLTNDALPVFSGYNGEGIIEIDLFHPEQEALDLIKEDIESRQAKNKNVDALRQLYTSITCQFDHTSSLSNGDRIIYACVFDTEAAEAAKYNITDTTLGFTVNGLAEYLLIDPFEGLEAYWQFGNEYSIELEIILPEYENSLSIAYTWSYGSSDYNGHSIYFHADADEEALKQEGILLTREDYEYELGPRPERITDLSQLSQTELEEIQTTITSLLLEELDTCQYEAQLNRSTIHINSISDSYISRDTAYFLDRTNGFTIVFKLDTDAQGFFNLNSYEVRYSGQIYRMNDGTIQFMTRTRHGCSFSGTFGNFTMDELR